MKRSKAWHDTPLGIAACWLGSIQFAVPILIFVAIALGWGTYLESTRSAREAKAAVYGSLWFMILMGLVCVSLIFAVVTRYPWKRKHVGFIIVHASLVTMIVAGFMSLFGRIEGHIGLDQGSTSSTLEMDQERLELVEHTAGEFRTLGEIQAPLQPGKFTIGGFPFEVVEVWENVHEEFDVSDDGADPYRAVRIQFGPMEASAIWIGDEAKGEAPVIDGMKIRVLADGMDWQPPASSASPATAPSASPAATAPTPGAQNTYAFVIGEQRVPLAAEGQEAFAGWKIVSIKRYSHATVSGSGLAEDPSQKHNPAVEVTITDGKGTTEQHIAFENFPDMIIAKVINGTVKSGARLVPPPPGSSSTPATSGAPAAGEETLVIFGKLPGMKVGYIGRDGAAKVLEHDGTFPWTADFGARKVPIIKQFAKAREQSHFVQAPAGQESRPALLIKNSQGETQALAWKAMIPVNLGGRMAILRFHPRTVSLPFAMRLEQFRKSDYPGTDMAMAYESDVTVVDTEELQIESELATATGIKPGQEETRDQWKARLAKTSGELPATERARLSKQAQQWANNGGVGTPDRLQTISMNNPLVQSGWKVYQSGFVGTNISIFSVMYDPGLVLTYIACVGLCLGILITFYGRGLTWGHPGIPTPFSGKESSNATSAPRSDPVPAPSLNGSRGHAEPALDPATRLAADPGGRAGDAAGHLRP